jgi:two-component system cell cycle sensor histidine kinase/response regulator CckA
MKTGPVVVVVEDESAVLQLIRRALSHHEMLVGHFFSDAVSALEFSQKGRIDLLITDVMLGKMTGFQLADRIRAQHPELRIIITSGYPSDAWAASSLPPNSVFLPKPFSPAELLVAVKQQLTR